MSLPAWKHTKIVCTLGPATDAPGVLAAMLEAGMDVARINTSHGSPEEHAGRIRRVRTLARRAAKAVAILIDLPGPKFRLGVLPSGSRVLERGERVVLSASADRDALPVPHLRLLRSLRKEQPVYLSDGTVRLSVTRAEADRAVCEVIDGGTVRSRSGINLPESRLPSMVPARADRRGIAFALEQQAEWIGVSFVETGRDLARVRKLLPAGARPFLVAKIERRRAIENLDSILNEADGAMVARGDLGVEADIAEIPILQKRIIAQANAKARPVITATQMLESMVEQERPTRAEVTDIANAVLDGTDAVMLSGETAIGSDPANAVATMRRVVAATEGAYLDRLSQERLRAADPRSPDHAVSYAACALASRVGAKAVVVRTSSIGTVLDLARYRPGVPLIVAADSAQLAGALAVVRGASAFVVPAKTKDDAVLDQARGWLRQRGLADSGDPLVVLGDGAVRIARL